MSQLMVAVSALLIIFVMIGMGILLYYVIEASSRRELVRDQRKFKVRFNPRNNKYYVTNSTSYGDIDIRKYIFFRVYYKSKIDADFVMQKMND